MTAIVRADRLVKRYPKMDRDAVDDLSLHIEAGTAIGMLGPNGAGKTTLTKLVCGVSVPTSGHLRVCGADPRVIGPHRYEIGVVHQSASFDMMLTVLDNLRISAAFKGLAWKEVRGRVAELMEAFGLAARAGQLAFTLSGGEQRRLQVVRALMRIPRLLVLDEPSAGLDMAGRRQVWGLISDMRREHGTTVLWASHYGEELERNCDSILIIDRGRRIEYATPGDLTKRFGDHTAVLRPACASELGRLAAAGESHGLTTMRLADRVEASGPQVRQQIPALLASLHTAGIDLATVEFRAPSLEDAFLALVKDTR
jgi:ABC-2 type transport system ATP-binding protein